uniref:Uncharacterized protein n=1 Tax=Cacopsylla melanoneura TaxID=428564 RepID=A0A8D8R6T4_9HEMI
MECPFKFRLTNSAELNPLHAPDCVWNLSDGNHGYTCHPYTLSTLTGGPLFQTLYNPDDEEFTFAQAAHYSNFRISQTHNKLLLSINVSLPNFPAAAVVGCERDTIRSMPVHLAHYIPRSSAEFWTIMHQLLKHGSSIYDYGSQSDDKTVQHKQQYWPSLYSITNLVFINNTIVKLSATSFSTDPCHFTTALGLVAVELLRNYAMFAIHESIPRGRLPRKVICKENFCKVSIRKRDGGAIDNMLLATYELFGKNMIVHHMRCVHSFEKTKQWCDYVMEVVRYKWETVDSDDIRVRSGRFSRLQLHLNTTKKRWMSSLAVIYKDRVDIPLSPWYDLYVSKISKVHTTRSTRK